MFAEQLVAAVATATTFTTIDALSRAVWKAHAAGLLDDAAAQAAAEGLEARKTLVRDRQGRAPERRAHGLLRRSTPRSPDREASLRRRRSCAASGAVPAAVACHFTLGEVAVLSVIAAEVRRAGSCDWPLDKIAALAGVCRRVAQYALRRAAALGHLHVQERPRPGQKHLPSVLTVVDAAWLAWLRVGTDRVQKNAPHEYTKVLTGLPIARQGRNSHAVTNDKKLSGGGTPNDRIGPSPRVRHRDFAHKKSGGKRG